MTIATEAEKHGFSINSVCWGYRKIFTDAIEELYAKKLLGDEKKEVTASFFGLLKKADKSCFDSVLHDFLSALNPRTQWLMDLPGLFADMVTLGGELAESKLYQGSAYFKLLGEGKIGDSPREVRETIRRMGEIKSFDEGMAIAFLRKRPELSRRLGGSEIDRFVFEGMKIGRQDRKLGVRFFEMESPAADSIIRMITRECRLEDLKDELQALIAALSGKKIEIDNTGALDSDDLIEHGSNMICLYRWVYLPVSYRLYREAQKNRTWYILQAVTAAGMHNCNSFPVIHGHKNYPDSRSLSGWEPQKSNLFLFFEFLRVSLVMLQKWPGVKRLFISALDKAIAYRRNRTTYETLLKKGLEEPDQVMEGVRALVRPSINCFNTARLLNEPPAMELIRQNPDLKKGYLPAPAFLPDFLFPGKASRPPSDSLVNKLIDEAERHAQTGKEQDDANRITKQAGATGESSEPDEEGESIRSCFLYREWNQRENVYYKDYCQLRELPVPIPLAGGTESEKEEKAIRQVRRLFERLKPDIPHREQRLPDGEGITIHRLIDYLVRVREEPDPRIDFYEKPLITRRDLSVLILMDVSGSTRESAGGQLIIDLEKQAARTFGEGLHRINDEFAICGFSSNGRERCEYYVYKEFDESWDGDARTRLAGAFASNSTRMGAALRHSGYKLAKRPHLQRLILLITDGKPMDRDYSPQSRYAHYDVRMACEENERLGISTFAISTTDNTRGDMELMFPKRRFTILPDMHLLPKILPQLYLKLTF